MIRLQSKEGHWFILEDDGKFFLRLKGMDLRMIGTVRGGEWRTSGPQWIRNRKCWAIARFPVVKSGSFNIRTIRFLELEDGAGRKHSGYIHPKLLYRRGEDDEAKYQYKDPNKKFELQVTFRPDDLQESREKADKKFEKWQEEKD